MNDNGEIMVMLIDNGDAIIRYITINGEILWLDILLLMVRLIRYIINNGEILWLDISLIMVRFYD